ncbi:MAG: hypothetical protein J6U69_03585 [Alistipes sp.]|nr:hypothetical protein [Alistipes sp.]
MEIFINDKKYNFVYKGFGAQYTYETITGETFSGTTSRAIHLLIYSTLLYCNQDDFSLSISEFNEWLYEHPAEESQMVEIIAREFARRTAASDSKKKE